MSADASVAAPPHLHLLDGDPSPGNHSLGFFKGTAGKAIRYCIFRTAGPSRGTVVLLQGRNESIEKYLETIGELTARGLWVATFDWRGQGGSERLIAPARRGHVRRFADYARDLSTFLEQIVLPDTRAPFFLIAHSMGALVALSQAPLLSTRIDRMILCAPFVALGGQSRGHGMIAVFSALLCALGLGRLPLMRDKGPRLFPQNLLTSDFARFSRSVTRAETYPQTALGPPSARWLHEMFGAIGRVTRRAHLARITVPTLILAPTQDRLVPYAAVERLARDFRAGHIVSIDGARHELFQEADRYRAQAIAAIEAFIPDSGADSGAGALPGTKRMTGDGPATSGFSR